MLSKKYHVNVRANFARSENGDIFRMGVCDSSGVLAVAKVDTQAGASAVITGRELRWGPIIPIAVESEIPVELAPKLDRISGIQIEVQAARIRNRREQSCADCQTGPIESEQL